MTVSWWQRSDCQALAADYVVVGAGIVGSYAAFCLAQTGADVLLTDMREPAAGASGRNAGFLLSGLVQYYHEAVEQYGHATAREAWQLSVETRELAFSLAQQLGVPAERCGSFLLATTRREARALERAARALEADGWPVAFQRGDPWGRGFAATLHKPDDGVVHPVKLVRAIAKHSGAQLVAPNEVWAIEARPGGVRVRGSKAEVEAKGAIVALNAYAPLVCPALAGLVRPVRGQMLSTVPLPSRVFDGAGYANWGYEYFRQLPDGRFLMGGGRRRFRRQETGWEDLTTPSVQGALTQFLERYFPEVAGQPIESRWSGTMGFTPDGLPLVGRLPDVPQAVVAVGFNGHGMGLGLKVAERAVDLLLNGTSPGFLDSARFQLE